MNRVHRTSSHETGVVDATLLPRPGHGMIATLALAMLMLTASAASAHKHPCGHHHSTPSVVTCNVQGAACTQSGNAGTCKSIQHRNRVTCECIPNQGGGGGCMALGQNFFSDQGDGPPAAFGSFIYLAQGDERNYLSVNNGDLFGPEFTAKDNPIKGTIEVVYGSFADPAAIPVTVENVSLSMPSVFGSGETFVELPGGAFQPMIYDSTTGVMDTVDENGLMLQFSNGFGTEVIPVHLNADLETGGFLVFIQGYSGSLIFPADFETGDLSRWASLGRWFNNVVNSFSVLVGLTERQQIAANRSARVWDEFLAAPAQTSETCDDVNAPMIEVGLFD